MKTTCHPQTNDPTKRFNCILEDILTMYTEWQAFLPFVSYAYSTATQGTTWFSPLFLLYGCEPSHFRRPVLSNSLLSSNNTKLWGLYDEVEVYIRSPKSPETSPSTYCSLLYEILLRILQNLGLFHRSHKTASIAVWRFKQTSTQRTGRPKQRKSCKFLIISSIFNFIAEKLWQKMRPQKSQKSTRKLERRREELCIVPCHLQRRYKMCGGSLTYACFVSQLSIAPTSATKRTWQKRNNHQDRAMLSLSETMSYGKGPRGRQMWPML